MSRFHRSFIQIFAIVCVVSWSASLLSRSAEAVGPGEGNVVGNGGGVWACVEGGGSLSGLHRIWLIDFYEGEDEFKLKFVDFPPDMNYEDIIKERRAWIATHLPRVHEWLEPELEAVSKILVEVDGLLTSTEDGAYRVQPSPDLCPEGVIEYRQMANYTPHGRILLQRRLWNSDRLPAAHRAGLVFHEAIYKYLRLRDGDRNSDRTRRLTALLFSNLSPVHLQDEIDAIMAETRPLPPKPKPFVFQKSEFANAGAQVVSNAVIVSGFSEFLAVSVSGGGSPEISISGGAFATSGVLTEGQSLQVRAYAPLFGGGAYNKVKITVGSYTTEWTVQTHAIEILTATYGANCGCKTNNATAVARSTCGNTGGCRLPAENEIFGDCAHDCKKNLVVSYRCTTSENPHEVWTSSVREHETSWLACW